MYKRNKKLVKKTCILSQLHNTRETTGISPLNILKANQNTPSITMSEHRSEMLEQLSIVINNI